MPNEFLRALSALERRINVAIARLLVPFGLALLCLPLPLFAADDPAPTPPTVVPQISAPAVVEETSATDLSAVTIVTEAPKGDAAATKFLVSCAGCHSLAGKKLTGPALNTAATWPESQLAPAIKKMEPDTGPLPDGVIAELMVFLKSPDALERLQAEEVRMAAQFAATMEPADPFLGARLFQGTKAFKNGGLSCAACHEADGLGGTLAPNLDGIFEKTGGELPLVSAIEQSKFKVMEPHYARHPVTKQEAMHLGSYFATLKESAPPEQTKRFAKAGAGVGVVLLVGMFGLLHYQRSTRGRDKRLQRRRK